jgi:hypothetical protein
VEAGICGLKADNGFFRRGDQREPHDSGKTVSFETLADLGVVYRQFPIDAEGKWKETIGESAGHG